MKKVLLLLANGFETFEASVFIDVIGWNYIDGDKSTQLFTCGRTKEVNSTFNQRIVVDYTFDEVNIDDYDALAIPGGFIEYDFYSDAYNEQFLEILRGFDKKGKTIASICVAALPLGKSGVLKGRKGTTYNKRDGIRQKQLKDFGVEVINQPIVIDQNIITSWNPSTAMEVAFILLEKLTNKENKDKVKELMGY
ncbi:DJ-1/PfpI family protein [Clostridium sp. CF011]|uniref:DJ-1/PfpI family protein n=1 Tax=unclassified Clostridium TaxID=2614128 RepID=UPI001C0DA904|nr:MULTISPECIES: DJ-1/PfpI family protein [unclassified Clostridium]MBU3090877.1 DJ-1/PfpI family protein [Clostridium sp. CF011]MBW9144556.1 DJ-1/PfpI family protein [Clostridium sp. CM027]UVE40680.1 DJ-1/PfpI family protein [Clostridium sp. CM027]WAG69648.1 DJ-1/PfpI family protein [Clostridium sp. CF011]